MIQEFWDAKIEKGKQFRNNYEKQQRQKIQKFQETFNSKKMKAKCE